MHLDFLKSPEGRGVSIPFPTFSKISVPVGILLEILARVIKIPVNEKIVFIVAKMALPVAKMFNYSFQLRNIVC